MSDYEIETNEEQPSVSVDMVDVPFPEDEDDEEDEEEEVPKSPKDFAHKLLGLAETQKDKLLFTAITGASMADKYKRLQDFQDRIHAIIPGGHNLHNLGSFHQMEEAITSIFYSISVAKGLKTMVEITYLALGLASVLKVPLFGTDPKITERAYWLCRKLVVFSEYVSSSEIFSYFFLVCLQLFFV